MADPQRMLEEQVQEELRICRGELLLTPVERSDAKAEAVAELDDDYAKRVAEIKKRNLVARGAAMGKVLESLLGRIDLPTGAELLTGSTRLKAGTATKVALNILSTGAMVQLGRVHGNLMIDLAATNDKLRDRAARLLMQIAGGDYESARTRLARHGWNVRAALAADRKA